MFHPYTLLSLVVLKIILGAAILISCEIYDSLNSDISCVCALLVQLVFGAAIIYAIAFYGSVLWFEGYKIGSVLAWACAIAGALWLSMFIITWLSAFSSDICKVKK